MQDNLEILERNQRQHLSKVTSEEYSQWLDLHMTKAFLLQFRIDLEDLTLNWINGVYSDKDGYKAQGTASYLENMVNDVGEFIWPDKEEDDA